MLRFGLLKEQIKIKYILWTRRSHLWWVICLVKNEWVLLCYWQTYKLQFAFHVACKQSSLICFLHTRAQVGRCVKAGNLFSTFLKHWMYFVKSGKCGLEHEWSKREGIHNKNVSMLENVQTKYLDSQNWSVSASYAGVAARAGRFAPLCMFQQSLEFVAETRILVEMKIENNGKIYFSWKKIDKHTFFSMKNKMMDLWMQIEGTKLMFIMNFSVLHFFKFASRMPQIAQILVSTFKILRGRRGGHAPRRP